MINPAAINTPRDGDQDSRGSIDDTAQRFLKNFPNGVGFESVWTPRGSIFFAFLREGFCFSIRGGFRFLVGASN